MKTLLEGKRELNSLPKSTCAKLGDIFECLKEVPLLEILKFIDSEKATKILSALDKIVSLANLSQSMGNYFARDDALDPALSIVCEGLRGDTDFEYLLKSRGGTFQSLASAYYHLKSTVDRDVSGRIGPQSGGGGYGFTNMSRRGQKSNKRGICWWFQRQRGCSKRDCHFDHRCMRCYQRNHGEFECKSQYRWGQYCSVNIK